MSTKNYKNIALKYYLDQVGEWGIHKYVHKYFLKMECKNQIQNRMSSVMCLGKNVFQSF